MSTPTLAQARSHYNRQRQIVAAGVLGVGTAAAFDATVAELRHRIGLLAGVTP